MVSEADPFETFAEAYDKFPRREQQIAGFFHALVEKYNVRSILDCACGTGSDLVLLHSLCPDVSGSDISEAMLNEARKKLSRHGINIPLGRVDFRHLLQHYNRRFDAVLCLRTSLPQLPDETDVIQALRAMKDVLNPGGVLVLSQGLTDKQFNTRGRFIPVINSSEHTRIMVIDYLDRHWLTHVLDCFRSGASTDFQVHTFQYLTLLEADYVRLLKEAGFARVEVYGDNDLAEYDRNISDSLIVVAQS